LYSRNKDLDTFQRGVIESLFFSTNLPKTQDHLRFHQIRWELLKVLQLTVVCERFHWQVTAAATQQPDRNTGAEIMLLSAWLHFSNGMKNPTTTTKLRVHEHTKA
jgi:hypothetical protein